MWASPEQTKRDIATAQRWNRYSRHHAVHMRGGLICRCFSVCVHADDDTWALFKGGMRATSGLRNAGSVQHVLIWPDHAQQMSLIRVEHSTSQAHLDIRRHLQRWLANLLGL
jgi:hypothetical protein